MSMALSPIGFKEGKNFHHCGFSNRLPTASGLPCKSSTIDFAALLLLLLALLARDLWLLRALIPAATSSLPASPRKRKISSVTKFIRKLVKLCKTVDNSKYKYGLRAFLQDKIDYGYCTSV